MPPKTGYYKNEWW